MNMLTALPLAASVSQYIPAELKTGVAFFIIVLMMICFILGVIQIMAGAAALDQGEEGKMKILTGLILAVSVFIVQGAYRAMGLPDVDWRSMGIQVPQQILDIIMFALITIIIIGFAWGAMRVVSGVREMRQDGQGKVKIFSGILIGASPWFMYGVYVALGLSSLGGQSMLPNFS